MFEAITSTLIYMPILKTAAVKKYDEAPQNVHIHSDCFTSLLRIHQCSDKNSGEDVEESKT